MASDNSKLVMIAAVNEAMKFKKQHPNADAEDIMPHVMRTIQGISRDSDAKISAIAAADSTIKFMWKNPDATEKQIFQFILDKSSEIMDSVSPRE
jgi:hypothetical protein